MARTKPRYPTTARSAACQAIETQVEHFPNTGHDALDDRGLSPADRRLAKAIVRTTLLRWRTIACLLTRHLRKRLELFEPAMVSVLLTGGAQLLFLDRLPAYAVIDESVDWAKRRMNHKAGGMVNAVLRRLAAEIDWVSHDHELDLSASRLPNGQGGYVHLKHDALPDPSDLAEHLAVVCSLPRLLVESWLGEHGLEQATAIALHSIAAPPITVTLEPGFEFASDADETHALVRPHERPGFGIFVAPIESLADWLGGHPRRQVQDVTSASSLLALPERLSTPPRVAIDACAGRGTKTRQLATMYPDCRVLAYEPDPHRRHDLQQLASELPNVQVLDGDDTTAIAGQADVLLLDVPCTNTGVLARRAGARHRFSIKTRDQLVGLQRAIARQWAPTLAPDGHLVYATCSIDPAENTRQGARLARELGLRLRHEHMTLPAGRDATWRDGGYVGILLR